MFASRGAFVLVASIVAAKLPLPQAMFASPGGIAKVALLKIAALMPLETSAEAGCADPSATTYCSTCTSHDGSMCIYASSPTEVPSTAPMTEAPSPATDAPTAQAIEYAFGDVTSCSTDTDGVCTTSNGWTRIESAVELNNQKESFWNYYNSEMFAATEKWTSNHCCFQFGDGTFLGTASVPTIQPGYSTTAMTACNYNYWHDTWYKFYTAGTAGSSYTNGVNLAAAAGASPYIPTNTGFIDTGSCPDELKNVPSNPGRNPAIFWRFPTPSPTTNAPTTNVPTASPTTTMPTKSPTTVPTKSPTTVPTKSPTTVPTLSPTSMPTQSPTNMPTKSPTSSPTTVPTKSPTRMSTASPSNMPTASPTVMPTVLPTRSPTETPTRTPTSIPIPSLTSAPTTVEPSHAPTLAPTTMRPTIVPTTFPTTGSCDGFELIDAPSSNCTALMNDGQTCRRKCSAGETVLGYYTCRDQSMRGQSICARTEVVDQEGLEVTTEKVVAGEVSIAVEGVEEDTLSALVQEAVLAHVAVSSETDATPQLSTSSPSPTQMATMSPTLNSQNSSNTFELNATLAGDTRRLQNSSAIGCLNQTTNGTKIPFSIALPTSATVISSAGLLNLLQSRLANDTQKSICVAWLQEPIETEELVITTRSGKVIRDAERYDIVTELATGDQDDDDEKGTPASEIAIAVAIAAIALLCLCLCCVIAISMLRRQGFYLNHWGGITYFGNSSFEDRNELEERETTPDFFATLSRCENGQLDNRVQEVQAEAEAKEVEASTVGNSGADFDDLTSHHDDSECGASECTWL